jgi:hypothetical protein
VKTKKATKRRGDTFRKVKFDVSKISDAQAIKMRDAIRRNVKLGMSKVIEEAKKPTAPEPVAITVGSGAIAHFALHVPESQFLRFRKLGTPIDLLLAAGPKLDAHLAAVQRAAAGLESMLALANNVDGYIAEARSQMEKMGFDPTSLSEHALAALKIAVHSARNALTHGMSYTSMLAVDPRSRALVSAGLKSTETNPPSQHCDTPPKGNP